MRLGSEAYLSSYSGIAIFVSSFFCTLHRFLPEVKQNVKIGDEYNQRGLGLKSKGSIIHNVSLTVPVYLCLVWIPQLMRITYFVHGSLYLLNKGVVVHATWGKTRNVEIEIICLFCSQAPF